jgi:PKD domain
MALTIRIQKTKAFTALVIVLIWSLTTASNLLGNYLIPDNASSLPPTGTDVLAGEDALSEVSIDVNPTDEDNLVINGHSSNLNTMSTFFTTDGGLTWTEVELGNANDGLISTFRFDPSVAFDEDGNVYVAYGVRTDPGTGNQRTVVVATSTNGGQTYTQFAQVATTVDIGDLAGNDKWHLATGPDPNNSAQQNVYITWTQNITEGGDTDQRIVVSVSTDGGATFSAPVIINDASISGTDGGNLTADPAVGSNGELYVAWHDFSNDRILFDVSTDGGTTWGTDVEITTSNAGFKTSIPAQPDRGISVGPTIDTDRSGGVFDGRIYLTYVDTGSGGLPNTDIFVRSSDDDGANWSAPVLVNDDGGTNSQFLPWLDVDQESGMATVNWYDARNDINNKQVDLFVSASGDGGVTFVPNLQVSDSRSDMSVDNADRYEGNFLEYIGIATLNCTSVPVWSDNSQSGADLDYFVDLVRPEVNGVCTTPTADANGPYSTNEGTNVVLDGSGSSDPDGDTLTFEWDFNNDMVFGDATGPTPTFDQVGQDGVFTVCLRVTDTTGRFAEDCTTVEVFNVPPDIVGLSSDAPVEEGSTVTVSGMVTDPGWLDPLTATIDWGDGTPIEAITGTLENNPPDATLTFTTSHVYGDNGTFTAQVCGSDGVTTSCETIDLQVDNVNPTAEIDQAGTILINGIPTFVAHAGDPLDFSGRSTDPGSDDLSLSWDWDDGSPSPDVTTIYLVNPPNADPFPSPSVQPRDVTDTQTHAFAQACLYEIMFSALDDDGGSASDTAIVLISGNVGRSRSSGYWQHQFGGQGNTDFDDATLECYLAIVNNVSTVFSEERDASTIPAAHDVLFLKQNGGSEIEKLDRELMTAWLNFANGAFEYDQLFDPDHDGVFTSFADIMAIAESVRLAPSSTKAEIREQRNIIQQLK